MFEDKRRSSLVYLRKRKMRSASLELLVRAIIIHWITTGNACFSIHKPLVVMHARVSRLHDRNLRDIRVNLFCTKKRRDRSVSSPRLRAFSPPSSLLPSLSFSLGSRVLTLRACVSRSHARVPFTRQTGLRFLRTSRLREEC